MKFPRRPLARTTLVALACASLALPAAAAGRSDLVAADMVNPARSFVADEVLVQFRGGYTPANVTDAVQRLGASTKRVLRRASQQQAGRGDLVSLKLPAGMTVAEAIAMLGGDAAVEFVEPNWMVKTAALPVDPYYKDGSLWGMYGDRSKLRKNRYGSQAAEAWVKGNTCSSDVVVGIIDEGVMTMHPDTQANIWVNPYDPVNGIDDDGNGFVDDVYGWDFRADDNSTFDGTGDDHGTHVSGTIGAVGLDNYGVAGMCWNVKMINAKFLGGFLGSGSTEDAILAIDYITDLKTQHGLNIVATNNSWGGGGYSQGLKDAITRAGDADILFVAAAGNGYGTDTDVTPNYPSAYDNDNIIAVAALASDGSLADFSNYGATTVDIAAPGAGIVSTVPGKSGGVFVGKHAFYDGTSMATPHVTGAVAMYASSHPGASAADIKAAILGSAAPTPSVAGKVLSGGRLDVSDF